MEGAQDAQLPPSESWGLWAGSPWAWLGVQAAQVQALG